MKSHRSLVLAPAFVGLVCLLLPGASSGADDPVPRPGQLRGVLSALNQGGDAWACQGSEWLLKREYVGHLLFLGTDPRGGTGGGGWYRPSQGRYGWEWLRRRCDRNGDGTITLAEFGGPREWFEALDKDRDGVLTKDDFDWASDSPLVKATSRVKPLFEKIDRDGSGRVTPEEWKLWFDALSGEKGYLSQDDLIPLFLEKGGRGKGPMTPMNTSMSKTRLAVVGSYVSCDVGSLSEGPAVDEKAPPFLLRTVDGKNRISLSAAPESTGQTSCTHFRQLHLKPLPVPVWGPGKLVSGLQGQGGFCRSVRSGGASVRRLDSGEQRKGWDLSTPAQEFRRTVSGCRYVLRFSEDDDPNGRR